MMAYDASTIEKKWQERWKKSRLHETDMKDESRPKYYSLVMFPYPSGDKLHIGHWFNFAPADSWARYRRMKGFNVFEPMGFDAFGLPAENYAIKTGVHPVKSIAENTAYMTEQLSRIGTMYDWSKTLNTSKPDYYKWTQWLFLLMYKRGLAERRKAPVNWCPSCQTVLANEQVQEGQCERCNTEVTKKDLVQWFWKMSEFAQRLLNGHKKLNWPKKTIMMQQNWIGKNDGITYHQRIKDLGIAIQAFDSIPQTFMAQTFAVMAPEHPLVKELVKNTDYEKPVLKFVEKIIQKKLAHRYDAGTEADGIFTGRSIENPFGTGDLPIWVASYVVMDYGSGIVNCSAHDERDFAFAKKYGIPLRPVMFPKDPNEAKRVRNLEYCYCHDEGVLEEPLELKGRKWGEVREDVLRFLEKNGLGKRTVQYRLRDWLISRQRYWGAPIPIIICPKCGDQPVPEKDLPVLLPENVDFKPRGDGKSPLATLQDFVKTSCPKCGGEAQRETDTMDTFVDSSFYYLRYLDPKNEKEFANKNLAKKWMPIDMYIGGPEHACMHLIYARFVNMVLFDAGISPVEEPFAKLVHQGLITYKGAKMSKSKGNSVSPDEFVEKYGSDVFRLYLMFMGPFEAGGDWNDKGIKGTVRFVERLYNLIKNSAAGTSDITRLLHKTIKSVTDDIEVMHFNTAIAALMMFLNEAEKSGLTNEQKKILVRLIAPLAPHLAEECWEMLGEKKSVFLESYPTYDQKLIVEETVTIVIQVNGRVRGTIQVPAGTSKEDIFKQALTTNYVQKHLAGKKIEKEIFIPDRLLNLVSKENAST